MAHYEILVLMTFKQIKLHYYVCEVWPTLINITNYKWETLLKLHNVSPFKKSIPEWHLGVSREERGIAHGYEKWIKKYM